MKDSLGPRVAEMIYYGFWYSPEFEAIRALIDESQKNVTGTARLKLYKGNCIVVGRRSPLSLYSEEFATFERDTVYNQRDAEGFIKLNALRLRMRKMAERDVSFVIASSRQLDRRRSVVGTLCHSDLNRLPSNPTT